MLGGGDAYKPLVNSRIFRNAARTRHFALHIVIELDPSFFHLWPKCSAKLLFQAPYQRVAKRSEMQWLCPNCACWRREWLMIDWNISRLSSVPTMAAIISI